LSDDHIAIKIDLPHVISTTTSDTQMSHCIEDIFNFLLQANLTKDESIEGSDPLATEERDEEVNLQTINQSVRVVINFKTFNG
jgi:hypothetical protein